MTEEVSISASGPMLQVSTRTNVTVPAEELCHYIKDYELEIISEAKKGLSAEICLTSTGIFFGSIIPAFEGGAKYFSNQHVANWIYLLSMLLCFASFVAAIITGLQWHTQSGNKVSIVDQIRKRPKIPVYTINSH